MYREQSATIVWLHYVSNWDRPHCIAAFQRISHSQATDTVSLAIPFFLYYHWRSPTLPLWSGHPLIQDPITWPAPRPLPLAIHLRPVGQWTTTPCATDQISPLQTIPHQECRCQRRANSNWIPLIVFTMATLSLVIKFLFLWSSMVAGWRSQAGGGGSREKYRGRLKKEKKRKRQDPSF